MVEEGRASERKVGGEGKVREIKGNTWGKKQEKRGSRKKRRK